MPLLCLAAFSLPRSSCEDVGVFEVYENEAADLDGDDMKEIDAIVEALKHFVQTVRGEQMTYQQMKIIMLGAKI